MRSTRCVLLLACLFLLCTSAIAGCGEGEGPVEKTGTFGQPTDLGNNLIVTPAGVDGSNSLFDVEMQEYQLIRNGYYWWVTLDLKNTGSGQLKVSLLLPQFLHEDGSSTTLQEWNPDLAVPEMGHTYVPLGVGNLTPIVVNSNQTLSCILCGEVLSDSSPVSQLQILFVLGDDPGEGSPQVKGTWDLMSVLD